MKPFVYYKYTEYGQVFWSTIGFIHYVPERRCEYRAEYFNPILEFLGVEIKPYIQDEEDLEEDIRGYPNWVYEYVRKLEQEYE